MGVVTVVGSGVGVWLGICGVVVVEWGSGGGRASKGKGEWWGTGA